LLAYLSLIVLGLGTAITGDLMASGLIEEVTTLPRASAGQDLPRGRPRVALKLVGSAILFAGIKLSAHENTLVILDFEGRQIGHLSRPVTQAPRPFAMVVEEISRMVDDGVAAAGLTRSDLSSIGIGIPGFIDASSGWSHWSPLLQERSVDVRRALSERLGLPVFVDNDANLVALAELWFGAGREAEDFLVVTIEHGVGMGLVLGQKVYRGTRGRGVEFGHTKVQIDGALCRCGQRGCLEAYVADYALLREAEAAMNLPFDSAADPRERLETLYAAARAGNAAALSIFTRAGRMLAVGLANMINIFDPGLIILAGERMQYDTLDSEDARAEIARGILGHDIDLPEIRVRRWGDLLWAKGAAALAMEQTTADGFASPQAEAADA
ncbi:MAG: ROK family protein, partial [Pseudomonadota bacterium]